MRYLVVWRVNSSLVQLPRCLSTALSQVMGTLIANRLPTPQARPWRKALAAWDSAAPRLPDEQGTPLPLPATAWPLEAVLLAYPGKRTYGLAEPILWELKLLQEGADHGLFLELILPAMEEAASTADPQWCRPHSLWGHFDIQAVYAARGTRWEPVVSEGRLNLRYRPTPTQWAQGLTFGLEETRRFQRLTWITPFDLGAMPGAPDTAPAGRPADGISAAEEPTLLGIVDALIERLTLFLPGKSRAAKDVWALLRAEEQMAVLLALKGVKRLSARRQQLRPAPTAWPGRWIGTQTFYDIPAPLLPYLELASILHIGKQTHFGCGTFVLT